MKLKRAGVGTKILILVLLAIVATTILSVHAQIQTAQAEKAALSQQVQALKEENAALADDIAHSSDPNYLENIARTELGLLEPGEIVFVDTSR